MKYIGLDYGSKKIGIAISDDSHKIAFARRIIPNDSKSIENLAALIKEEKVEGIVVGESLNFQGKENDIMAPARKFAAKLSGMTGLQPEFFPEYLSSSEAGRIINDKNDDARAAAIILQAYLDNLNNKEK